MGRSCSITATVVQPRLIRHAPLARLSCLPRYLRLDETAQQTLGGLGELNFRLGAISLAFSITPDLHSAFSCAT